MQRFGIGEKEMEMAKLLWANEGIGSGAVVKLCKEKFDWAKSTTYTMLRRLCEHGLFQNVNSVVTSVMSEEDYKVRTATQMINDKFDGSLHEFVRCVLKTKNLTNAEYAELENLLN